MAERDVSYPAKLRDRAKAEGLALVTMDIDGRPAKTFGRMTVQVAVPKDKIEALAEFAAGLLKKEA